MTIKTFKLYRVTYAYPIDFANGDSVKAGDNRMLKASSLHMAGSQASCCNGGDILSIDLVAVDSAITGKSARPIASLVSPIATRHMNAFTAKVLARRAMAPSSNLRVMSASNHAVTFRVGGAY